MRQNDRAIEETVAEHLEEGRLHEALGLLNSTTSHRFTGVYRLDAATLRNVALFDRNNPDLRVGADTPLLESYCSIVAKTGEPFATDDTREDPRLTEHPARDSTLSYCGVPLDDEGGRAFGSLCHFDLVPHEGCEGALGLLERVASRLAEAARGFVGSG